MTNAQEGRATRREWIGLAAIALPCLVYAMDVTILHLAVPTLTVALRPSASQLLWIVDIYGFLLAGSLITMGTLGDRIGRRRLLMIGAASFATASVLAAFSVSASMLILARAILGVAAATLAPSTLSLIRNMFHDPQERTTAIGIWGTSFAAGGAIGPLIGGLLLQRFWWGSVFLVPVPVMIVLLLVGPRLLPEFRDPVRGHLDLRSAALSMGAVLSAIYGVKLIAQNGLESGWTALASIAVGAVLGLVFIRRQKHLAHPFVDLRLFRVPIFTATMVALTLNVFALFGVMFFTAQYFQLVIGLSPLRAGLWMLPSSLAIVMSSMSSARLARIAPRTTVLVVSMLACATGFGILTMVGSGGLPIVVAASMFWGFGAGPVGTLSTDIIMGAAAPERAGSVASLSETSAEFGGALGLAVLGSVGTVAYRLALGQARLPVMSAEAARVARGTLGGAVSVSTGLPVASASQLLRVARDAFTSAYLTISVVSLVLMVASAGLMTMAARERSRLPAAADRS